MHFPSLDKILKEYSFFNCFSLDKARPIVYIPCIFMTKEEFP